MKYNKNNETTNKYLAGLIDGDGMITISVAKTPQGHWKPRLVFQLALSRDNLKSEKVLLDLFDHYKYGSIRREDSNNMIIWNVSGDKAKSIINRIKKHLVIKGIYSERMIQLWESFRGYGNYIKTEKEASELVDHIGELRDITGPIKPKTHPTWAWLAGYTDTDGSIKLRNTVRKDRPGDRLSGCCDYHCHERGRPALELISKAFGREITIDKNGYIRLRHHFGPDTYAFAKKMLIPMLTHLKLKRWEAEQILCCIKKEPAETE